MIDPDRLAWLRQHAPDALEVRIVEIAASYPDAARFTPREEREEWFTPAQRLAWALRFASPAEFASEAEALTDDIKQEWT